MSRDNPGDELDRYHLYLDKEDMAWFKETFGQTTGLSKAIRAILRSYRKRIESTAAQGHKRVEMSSELQAEVLAIAAEDHRGKA